MKKVIGLLVALCVMFGVTTNTAITVNAQAYGGYTFEVAGDTAIITGCDSTIKGDVVIPASLDGHPVKEIARLAFAHNYNITSVTIPNGVQIIRENAFAGCVRLITVKIADSVTTIEAGVFQSCNYLENVILPKGLKEISSILFENTGIETITLPSGVKTIGFNAFAGCRNLKSVVLPDGLKIIESEAFKSCDLRSITIPASVKEVSDHAFTYNSSLKTAFVLGNNTVLTPWSLGHNDETDVCTTMGLVIVCKKNSKAAAYAKQFGFKVVNYTPEQKLSSISKYKGAFKAKWKKNTTCTGYQLRYSLNSNMSGAKTVTITKNKTTSKKVTKLKKKTKYYVQIRTYKTVNGIKVYGDWSAKKSVKTK